MTVTYLSPRRVCRQTCSSTPIDRDAVEPVRVVDQHPLAFGEDRVVGGVPRHAEALGDAGHGEVLTHDALPAPSATPRRDSFARGSRRPAGVLAPHVPAAGAPVAADRDQQRRGPPTQRLVRQPRGSPCRAALPSQPQRRHHGSGSTHPAGQHRPVRLAAAARSPARPSSSRRQNVVRSGRARKVASGMSRSSGWAA